MKPSKSRLLQATMLACMIVMVGRLPATGQDSLRITKGESDVVVRAGEQPVLRYQYIQRPMKPYVQELFSPGSVNVLRDSPADHKHHHALMFAVAVDGVDFWAEGNGCGRQEHRSLGELRTFTRCGMSWAGFAQRIDWINPRSRKALLSERRTIEVCHCKNPQATLVVWQTRLEPAVGKDSVKLTGSHYFGLGMRFVQSMDKVGRFFNADNREGELVRGDNRLVQSKWCAYTAPAGGERVTVAVFDHPGNPRHPARMFTMAKSFAYLGATLNLWKEPMTLKAGEPLELRYAVALCDGEVKPARIEQLYRRWITCFSTDK